MNLSIDIISHLSSKALVHFHKRFLVWMIYVHLMRKINQIEVLVEVVS
jgi:hypothetical protein